MPASFVMPRLYPLFADLAGRRVLVVGGGAVAERKARALLDTGAQIVVVAPAVTAGLRDLDDRGLLAWRRERFTPVALAGAWLVIAAGGTAALNREVARAARARRVFANVVDDAALSGFHVPALVNRAPVQVAVSTGGAAPALAAAIRERFEALLDESLGPLAALLARRRPRIKRALPDLRIRRAWYRSLLSGAIVADLRTGRLLHAERRLARELEAARDASIGRVALVGAGPGDAGLLTLRGLRLLQEADVIFHDRLVSHEVLALARRDARIVAVGKRPGEGGYGQARIQARLVEEAEAKNFVVRLKGGDPFIFGRGGEEIACLRARGIPCEVVPGITAASGCAARIGVPLTHRVHAHTLQFIVAHDAAAVNALDVGFARAKQTLVVYMGVGRIEQLTQKLIALGRAPDTPFALIENGTRPEQRVVTGELERLVELARQHSVQPPALLIVGEVAAFASRAAGLGTDSDFSSVPQSAAA